MIVGAAALFPAVAPADEAADKAASARQAVALAVVPGRDGRIGRMIGQAVEALPADTRAAGRADRVAATAGVGGDLVAVFAAYDADAFTADALKPIAGFHASPAGRRLVAVEEGKPAEVSAAIPQRIMKRVAMPATAAGRPR